MAAVRISLRLVAGAGFAGRGRGEEAADFGNGGTPPLSPTLSHEGEGA